MKISIIIPIYNTGQYLSRCIESILNQSCTDFEVLLVDDGSTDGSGAICDVYAEKDSRVRVFHKGNGGVSSARNMGLEHALGDWVTFVDSDDYVEKDYLSIDFDSNHELYIQNWRYANGKVKDYYEPMAANQDKCLHFLKDNVHTDLFRTVYCFFYRRDILVANGLRFDTRFKLGEDTLFVMDYYKFVESIRIVGNSYYVYNRQDNWHNKYCLTLREAISYLDTFMDKNDALPFDSFDLLGFMFTFIKNRIKINGSYEEFRWAVAKPVLRYKKRQLPYKGMKYRMKYYLAKFASAFVNE